MTDRPEVSVWAKTTPGWMKVGELRTWKTLTCEPRHLQPGAWSMSMPYDDQALKVLVDRAFTIDFRGQRIMTGLIDTFSPKSDENGQPSLDVTGIDAMTLLGDVLAWPVPGSPIGSQTVENYTASGPAETVLRGMASANLARRGDDIVFAANLARGGTVNLSVRFDNLLDVIASKCQIANLGVKVGLVNTTGTRAQMTVEFYTPADRTQRVRLSHKVGTFRSWEQSTQLPSVTKAIVGGAGDSTARVFAVVTDAASETMWRRSREVFVDARDTFDSTTLTERGTEAITEGAAQSSFSLEAAEAEGMRYVKHYSVGDKVTVELLTGLSTTDYLGAVRLECGDSGTKVTPIVGNPNGGTPEFTTGALITALRQRIRKLEQRK